MTAAKRRRSNPSTPAVHLAVIREAFVPDPHGHRGKLAAAWEAWNASEVGSAEVGRLAFQLAEAVGACLVTHTHANGLSLRLPAEIALAAFEEVSEKVLAWTTELDGAGAEGDNRAADWFPRRHTIWLAVEGIRKSAPQGPVFVGLHALIDKLDLFDRALLKCKPTWNAWIESDSARISRDSLQGAYRAALPWWLDPESVRAC